MNLGSWLVSTNRRLDIVAGLVDGILTALTLTAAKMLEPRGALSLELALRISAAAALTTMFVFFLAHYAQLRTELIHAERQLNVLRHGRLASSDLGQAVLRDALAGATLAAACSTIGALLPMLIVVVAPGPPWIGCSVTVAILAGLGAALAESFHGSRLRWASALFLAGIAMTIVGAELRIAG